MWQLLAYAWLDVAHRFRRLRSPCLHEQTFSAHIMELIAAFVTGRQGLTGDDVAAWLADLRARAAEGDYLFSIYR